MILPSRRLVLHTPLTPDQAAQALQGDLVEKRGWAERLSRSGGGGFVGRVTGTVFECQRDINYRNSFLPQLKGAFTPDAERGGSRVTLVLALHPLVAAFMYAWLGFVLLIGVPMAIATLSDAKSGDGGGQVMGGLIPLGMLVFGLVLPRLAFGYEAKQAVAFVKSTLSAQELEPPAR
jgi:hypothetical protein